MATIMAQYGAERGGVKGRRCDATCHRAKKPRCACICGGRYHGKGSSEAAQQQLTKDWLGDDWVQQVETRRGVSARTLTRAEAAYELFQERTAPLLRAGGIRGGAERP